MYQEFYAHIMDQIEFMDAFLYFAGGIHFVFGLKSNDDVIVAGFPYTDQNKPEGLPLGLF